MKTALIAGITGQDGAYLAQYLLGLGYRVIGLHHKGRNLNLVNLDFLRLSDRITFVETDLSFSPDWRQVIETFEPSEIYGLAGQSLVWASWGMAPLTLQFNIDSVTAMLEAIRDTGNGSRAFVALSSEIFGQPAALPITEQTPLSPATPYAISKVTNYWLARTFRDHYGIFVASGFLFNHESVLRPSTFVVQKIINTAFQIACGNASELCLGNVAVRRDFGYAPEYVAAMHMMLSADEPDDYVIATGTSISIREIVEQVFCELDVPMSCLRVDSRLIRAGEVMETFGCADLAAQKIGWSAKYKGAGLVSKLIEDHQQRLCSTNGEARV